MKERVTKNYFIDTFFLLYFFLSLLLILPAMVYAGESANELFTKAPASADLYIKKGQARLDPTIIRKRHVEVNFDYLDGKDLPQGADTVVLNLFYDVSLTAGKERMKRKSANRYTWFGRIEGVEHGQVILVVENGSMAGNVTAEGRIYQIRATDDGIHTIYEIDQSAFPEEVPPIPIETPDILDLAPLTSQGDDGSVIDVMVVYTEDTATASGNIASEIQLAIEETNQSYINSGVNQRLNLIHSEQVTYTETGDMYTDLSCIQSTTDGCLDDVHTWRDTHGADMVSFWVENGGSFCGLGYLMTTVSGSFAPFAFSVVDRGCATGYYTFGHELGHNMGAHHDRANASGQGAYNYSYGYQDPNESWRTVMAYNCPGGCARVQYWSNPDVSYNGEPMGIPEGQPDAADNRKTLDNTAYTIANFRQSVICSMSFSDVPPGYWAEDYINAIYCSDITTGYGDGTYRPEDTVTRAEMAAFIIRALYGETFSYNPSPYSPDVTGAHWAFRYIQRLYEDGITTGFPDGTYRPEDTVSRAEMAAFIIRALYGESFSYNPSPYFPDVLNTHWSFKYVQRIYEDSITTGYGDGTYRPGNIVTRAEMAAFLGRAFLGTP